MTVRQQWSIVGAVVLVLALGAWAATHFLGDELFQVKVGSDAPGFTAKTLDVNAPAVKTLSDYRDKVVLLNVWATWCVPCRSEMPSIQALHKQLGPHGLKIVAVSVDNPGSEQQIRDFAKEYGLTFEILQDETGAIQRIYQTTGVPETFVIGRDGVIRKKIIGAADWSSKENVAVLRELLGLPPAAPGVTPADTAHAVPVAGGG
jgi:peroxiredoxin